MDEFNTAEVNEISEDIMFDGWGDDSNADVAEESEVTEEAIDEQPESGNQTEESVVDDDNNEATVEEPSEPVEEATESRNQKFKVKHLNEERELTADEIVPLAQKGMDYDFIRADRDSIRSERDSMSAELAKLRAEHDFLEELRGDFATVDDLIDDTRAKVLAQSEGIDEAVALERVKAARNAPAPATVAPEQTAEQKRDADIQQFVQRFPGVMGNDIPQEVWAEVNNGKLLTDAYAEYSARAEKSAMSKEIEALKAELETLKQNNKNAERSTGSRESAGTKTNDSIYDGWGDSY